MSAYSSFVNKLTLRRLTAIMSILCLIILAYPLGIPKTLIPQTVDAYNTVKELNPGEIVIWGSEIMFGMFVNSRDAMRAFLWHVADQGVQVVFCSFSTWSPTAYEYMVSYSGMAERYNWVHGVDYVILPYLPGEEMAMAALAENMWVTGKDMYGTPLDEHPLMQRVHRIPDATLLVTDHQSSTLVHAYVRQWLAKYNMRGVTQYAFETYAQYYNVYTFGCSTYTVDMEILTGYLGEEVIKLDAANVCIGTGVGLGVIAIVLKKIGQSRGEEIKLNTGADER